MDETRLHGSLAINENHFFHQVSLRQNVDMREQIPFLLELSGNALGASPVVRRAEFLVVIHAIANVPPVHHLLAHCRPLILPECFSLIVMIDSSAPFFWAGVSLREALAASGSALRLKMFKSATKFLAFLVSIVYQIC